jgi:hypothetical protein
MALQTKDYSVVAKSSNKLNTYTYILRVTENSVNEDTNTSNLTIKAIVKCSYSNIMKNVPMVVDCTLNGIQVFSNSAKRTMGAKNTEHVFYTWTGDVEHNADGSLILAVGGNLTHTTDEGWMPITPMTIHEDESNIMEMTFIQRGLVYIDNGSGFEAYQCYIYNGTEWELYMPYVDNGTDWELCG